MGISIVTKSGKDGKKVEEIESSWTSILENEESLQELGVRYILSADTADWRRGIGLNGARFVLGGHYYNRQKQVGHYQCPGW